MCNDILLILFVKMEAFIKISNTLKYFYDLRVKNFELRIYAFKNMKPGRATPIFRCQDF